jgi:hypothetical protein
VSPVSRHRSGKDKGKSSSHGGGSSKEARSGNPQIRALAAEEQALRAEHRRLTARSEQQDEELRRLRRERRVLLAERDRLLAEFSAWRQVSLDTWYAGHAAALVAEAYGLTAAADPAALEQATAELVADRLLAMRDDESRGWEATGWVTDWLTVVAAEAVDHAEAGSWLLLHGLAAICPPDLAALMLQSIEARAATAPPSPSWLPLTPQLAIDPAARVFADAYGLRSAVLIGGRRPDRPARTYLLDVDLCPGHPTIVGSGWYADQDTALAAWASAVGPSAGAPVGGPGPVLLAQASGAALGAGAVKGRTSAAVEALGELLPLEQDPLDVLLGEDDPRERAVGLLRDQRIIADLTAALAAAGADLADRTAGDLERGQQWAAQEAPGFRAWCSTRAVQQAPADVVEEMLAEWAAYTPPRLVWACSPHRVVSFAAQLSQEWADRNRLRIAWSLVEPWAEYCLDRCGLPEHLAAPVRDAARAVTGTPGRIAAHAVDTWKTATNETHPLGS